MIRVRFVACHVCGGQRRVLNGAYLRQLREDAGVSLRELARRSELSAAYLSDVELNRRNCTARVHKIYARLGER